MQRLSREASAEATRSSLLAAGRRVFLRHGYHRTTLDQVALEAGYTKGAVYSRFASKDDLFFALWDQRHEQMLRVFDDSSALKSFEEFALRDARRLIALRREEADWYLLLLEFATYAARDERLRREFAARHNRAIEHIAARVAAMAVRLRVQLRLPAIEMARASWAMAQGYTLERLTDPIGVSEQLLESMFMMLAHEAVGDGRKWRAARRSEPVGRTSVTARRNNAASARRSANSKVR